MTEADILVVGGGVVGLGTALALAPHFHEHLTVIEAEPSIATHQTGHNSGVIHSGLYYAPGSLKATLCAEGREALYRFCEEHGVPHERCGKVVVATDASELDRLEALRQRGVANGLRNMRVLSRDEFREIEPHTEGVAALRVEETGIVNYGAVSAAYAEVIAGHGAAVRTRARLVSATSATGESWRRRRRATSVRGCWSTAAGLLGPRGPRLRRGTRRSHRAVPRRVLRPGAGEPGW